MASFALMAGLAGCVSTDMADLQAYSEEVLARKGGRIEPLPEIKPYERYLYQSAELGKPDPFAAFADAREKPANQPANSKAVERYLGAKSISTAPISLKQR